MGAGSQAFCIEKINHVFHFQMYQDTIVINIIWIPFEALLYGEVATTMNFLVYTYLKGFQIPRVMNPSSCRPAPSPEKAPWEPQSLPFLEFSSASGKLLPLPWSTWQQLRISPSSIWKSRVLCPGTSFPTVTLT